MKKYEVHGVLAAAYPGRGKANPKTILTHATDADWNPLCKTVKPANICDTMHAGPPSCAVCVLRLRAKLRRLARRGVELDEQAEIRTLLGISEAHARIIAAQTTSRP